MVVCLLKVPEDDFRNQLQNLQWRHVVRVFQELIEVCLLPHKVKYMECNQGTKFVDQLDLEQE